MSAQNDDEFSLDPTAPRAQPGPDERQSHGGSSPPQPHSSSSSSVTVSRQAPEAMHVGIRPQGMPGFHPAASSASYYPGAVFAGGAASAAPPPGAVPVPRHSYLFEARAPLGFAGVVQQPLCAAAAAAAVSSTARWCAASAGKRRPPHRPGNGNRFACFFIAAAGHRR